MSYRYNKISNFHYLKIDLPWNSITNSSKFVGYVGKGSQLQKEKDISVHPTEDILQTFVVAVQYDLTDVHLGMYPCH